MSVVPMLKRILIEAKGLKIGLAIFQGLEEVLIDLSLGKDKSLLQTSSEFSKPFTYVVLSFYPCNLTTLPISSFFLVLLQPPQGVSPTR